VLVEPTKLPRHLAIARHHVKQTDHRHDGGVGRAQEQQAENNSDDPAKNLSDRGRKGRSGKLLPDEAQHVFTPLAENCGDGALVS
jgi:hypothetical protein